MSDLNDKKTEWIEEAYLWASESGIDSLNIETLSRLIGKSKSSFYHHFGDLDMFTRDLLQHHVSRSALLGEKLKLTQEMNPGVIDLLVEHKTDVLFHRYLRVKQHVPAFQECFHISYGLVKENILPKWLVYFELESKEGVAETFLDLIAENFLLRITKETYTKAFLEAYLIEIHELFQKMRR